MKQILLSFVLLCAAASVQAQRVPCVHSIFPKQSRPSTRAVVGNPKTYLGEKKGLIILMEFPNQKFVDKNKNGKAIDVHGFWNDLANKEGLKNVNGVLVNGSIRDYFTAQSYGQFTISFDVCGPYTAKNKYAYYGRNADFGGGYSFDEHPYDLIIEACQAADKDVNFKDYDWDEDGEVDQVYVVYAGHGEASYDESDLIWPHESEISNWTGSSLSLQGMTIDTYACGNELDSQDRTMGIGTICHEFSHCLGLPDVYDAETGASIVEGYDVMDAGNYNGDSWYPAGYSAFERYFCGWIEPKPYTSASQAEELLPLHANPDALIYRPFVGSTNYYMVENRAKESWDKFLPCFTSNATGEALDHKVLAWYIDYDQEKWNRDRPNIDPDNLGISLVELADVPTAIVGNRTAAAVPEAWYDLNGRKFLAPPSRHGIYIMRLSDGTTKKCIR